MLKQIDLLEISVVGMPANLAARVIAVKDIRHFEAVLRYTLGFGKREARKLASRGWPALSERDVPSEEVEQMVRATKARIDTLKKLF